MKPITLEEVLRLPVAERIRIVEAIWDSIADSPEALDLSDEQKAELDRRLEDLEKNPNAGSPWSEVRDRVWRGRRRTASSSDRRPKTTSPLLRNGTAGSARR